MARPQSSDHPSNAKENNEATKLFVARPSGLQQRADGSLGRIKKRDERENGGTLPDMVVFSDPKSHKVVVEVIKDHRCVEEDIIRSDGSDIRTDLNKQGNIVRRELFDTKGCPKYDYQETTDGSMEAAFNPDGLARYLHLIRKNLDGAVTRGRRLITSLAIARSTI